MDQPWYYIGIGALFTVFGGALGLIGITEDTPVVALIGWAVGSVSGLLLFVGLIALAVEVGVRAADR